MSQSSSGWSQQRATALACLATAVTIGGVVLSVQPSSTAAAASNHSVTLNIKEAAINFEDAPGGPPIKATEVGLVSGSLGSGVNRTDVRVRDGNGTRRFFTRQGTFYGTFVFHGVHKKNGDTIVGTLTITSGTGRFHGAHGTLHINGFHNDNTGYSTEHLTGALTY